MIISIAHSKGGCGKSLLTLNLAPLINNLVLIDLDTQNSITEINKARKVMHSINHALSENEFFLPKYSPLSILIVLLSDLNFHPSPSRSMSIDLLS